MQGLAGIGLQKRSDDAALARAIRPGERDVRYVRTVGRELQCSRIYPSLVSLISWGEIDKFRWPNGRSGSPAQRFRRLDELIGDPMADFSKTAIHTGLSTMLEILS